jgi:hypothetical protein
MFVNFNRVFNMALKLNRGFNKMVLKLNRSLKL